MRKKSLSYKHTLLMSSRVQKKTNNQNWKNKDEIEQKIASEKKPLISFDWVRYVLVFFLFLLRLFKYEENEIKIIISSITVAQLHTDIERYRCIIYHREDRQHVIAYTGKNTSKRRKRIDIQVQKMIDC